MEMILYWTCQQSFALLNRRSLYGKYEQMLIIRKIHHFGYFIWLGGRERIKSFSYDKIDDENGPVSIITSKNQYIVPRQMNSKSTARVALYKKKIYNVKKEKFLKELVIENNVPKLINYQIEHKYSLSDEGKGIKGYLNAKTKDSEHEILVI